MLVLTAVIQGPLVVDQQLFDVRTAFVHVVDAFCEPRKVNTQIVIKNANNIVAATESI